MKKTRFAVEQMVAVLKQTELGMSVSVLIRQVGILKPTFCRWKKQYAGLQSDQVRELKQLQEKTNARRVGDTRQRRCATTCCTDGQSCDAAQPANEHGSWMSESATHG